MSTIEDNEALREKYSSDRITQKDGSDRKGIYRIV
tara:strand:+ start:341 stop:445 length:105 start_codon:yes stop_codon:yes gene_type:complete